MFGVAVVELLVKAVLRHYERQDARQVGIMVRAVIRTIGYMTIAVATLSILAANPAFCRMHGWDDMAGLALEQYVHSSSLPMLAAPAQAGSLVP